MLGASLGTRNDRVFSKGDFFDGLKISISPFKSIID